MSDISVLSNQYEQLVTTSDKVNNSVIVLKKNNMLSNKSVQQRYPKLAVSENEVNSANSILASFLQNVIGIIKGDSQESQYIPSLILEDYKEQLSKNPYMREDIEELLRNINDLKQLEDKHMTVLDSILSVLDIERSALFRKLRTARG
ncbi:MAG: hypothetical protein EOP48_26515 [Sphingobacteriales bacterium]|nr:MAG: hypothetical protein EOP48_26515 [Sphingobacteriales bacterium]